MNEREMLELAAKAVGYHVDFSLCASFDGETYYTHDRGWHDGNHWWNPLIDDGDALRMAAKLRLDLCWNENEGPWEFNAWPQGGGMGSNECPSEGHGDDNASAMRKAIVRAAAEIGKSMP